MIKSLTGFDTSPWLPYSADPLVPKCQLLQTGALPCKQALSLPRSLAWFWTPPADTTAKYKAPAAPSCQQNSTRNTSFYIALNKRTTQLICHPLANIHTGASTSLQTSVLGKTKHQLLHYIFPTSQRVVDLNALLQGPAIVSEATCTL